MLDMLGSGYVIEHCVAEINKRNRADNFRYYMADCAAGVLIRLGVKDVKRLYDFEHSMPEDDRTPEEIIDDITARAGLKVVKKHERISPDGDTGA